MKRVPLLLLISYLTCLPVTPFAVTKYPYQSCFEVASSMHDLPLDLLLAVAATESNYEAMALSKANAHGIMQIQWPGTAKHLGIRRVGELYNPCLNIETGARYLRQLLDQFNNETRALAAYNYGPTRIAKSDKLPEGAKSYVATVGKHRRKIMAGRIPQELAPKSQRLLATFESKHRAQRVATFLTNKLEGATVTVREKARRRFAVVLAVGGSGLTMRDQITLENLGWSS